jgi:hypothetical protein
MMMWEASCLAEGVYRAGPRDCSAALLLGAFPKLLLTRVPLRAQNLQAVPLCSTACEGKLRSYAAWFRIVGKLQDS